MPSYIALFAVLVSAGYILSLNNNPKVVLLSDKQGQYLLRDISVYQKASKAIMSRSILSRSKFTIDTNALAEEMKKQFPELDEVAITIPLAGRRPIFELSSSRPALILVTQDNSLVIDQNGRAVVSTADLPKKSNLSIPLVTDQSGLKSGVGKIAMPSGTVNFIQMVTDQLKAKKLTVKNIELPAVANELRVRLDGQPYYIKFNLEGRAREQVGAYLSAKQKFETDHSVPSEYVDVRVDERVYYK